MSRSFRLPASYITTGADPAAGKARTSRILRSMIRAQLNAIKGDVDTEELDDLDPFVDDPRDVTRGHAGTRDEDYGYKYFGDGRYIVNDKEYQSKLVHK
ncbi:MAG: hypothetical protein NUW00_04735 [Candidatus Kaiserbacteria bacterium]|nr:hypothetical protein [Candidatus Kaiserbacteria bacterium]